MMITIPGEGVGKRTKGKYALFPFRSSAADAQMPKKFWQF